MILILHEDYLVVDFDDLGEVLVAVFEVFHLLEGIHWIVNYRIYLEHLISLNRSFSVVLVFDNSIINIPDVQ